MSATPTAFVRDIYDGHKAEHYPALDTPSHFCTVEMRVSRAGGSKKMVPRYSLMLRSRSELVVSL